MCYYDHHHWDWEYLILWTVNGQWISHELTFSTSNIGIIKIFLIYFYELILILIRYVDAGFTIKCNCPNLESNQKDSIEKSKNDYLQLINCLKGILKNFYNLIEIVSNNLIKKITIFQKTFYFINLISYILCTFNFNIFLQNRDF